MTMHDDTSLPNRPARGARSESGTAMLEMAITLPLLLLVLFGIFEIGLAFARVQVLSNAAREGARVASLFRASCDADTVDDLARTAVEDTGERLGMSSLQIQVTNKCVAGERVRVRVQFNHELPVLSGLTSLIGGGNESTGGSLPLTAQAEMLNEIAP